MGFKKALAAALAACVAILASCAPAQKRTAEFYGAFDTVTTFTAYARGDDEFAGYLAVAREEMLRLHRLFDIYHDYEGLNNLKTVNDNAGVRPVAVAPEIIDLLELGRYACEKSGGKVNIAMGAVLRVWHEYREMAAAAAPESAAIPPEKLLQDAALHSDIGDVVIDRENGTVYLSDPEMSLDVGAIAKGFAVQRAGEALLASGCRSAIINAGGNVTAIGRPLDGRQFWSVGVQDPDAAEQGALFDTVCQADASVVTSGDYQRFYVVQGRVLHHIIDPGTLMPADRYAAVTVLHADGSMADLLSTALFLLPRSEGERLLREVGGEALWIYSDRTFEATDGYMAVSQKLGETAD